MDNSVLFIVHPEQSLFASYPVISLAVINKRVARFVKNALRQCYLAELAHRRICVIDALYSISINITVVASDNLEPFLVIEELAWKDVVSYDIFICQILAFSVR